MLSWLFLAVSIWGLLFTINGFIPLRRPGVAAFFSFLAGWLTTELTLHHIFWQAVATVVFIALGALDAWPGWLGLALTLGSWVGLHVLFKRSRLADVRIEGALMEGLGDEYRVQIADLDQEPHPLRWLVAPFYKHPRDIVTRRRVVYAEQDGVKLEVDIRHPKEPPPGGAPVFIYVHGGGWVVGQRHNQGIPMMRYLASRGWACFSIEYRLSPRAAYPAHLHDVKRGVAWVKRNAHEYGGDASFVVLSGNSAGGHLSSLCALTPNEPRFQPGFEDEDTAVDACVPFYGVYDFTNRFGHWPHQDLRRLLEWFVVKKSIKNERQLFEEASPMHWISEDAPPMMLLHGTHDTLVPVEEARRFHAMLLETSRAPVVYAEIPGAQHAYEIFPSIRTEHTIHGVERFITWTLHEHRRRAADAP